ncbi:Endonuclease/Exonuclease/phosphatase family protein [Xylogone sp. PMI_703]|nr:Endonuclease/Exonuclease/phosphatase family protein [Xylogone sp. PMI_703]
MLKIIKEHRKSSLFQYANAGITSRLLTEGSTDQLTGTPFSSIHTPILEKSRYTPSPIEKLDILLTFQTWNKYDSSNDEWVDIDMSSDNVQHVKEHKANQSPNLVLATWNLNHSLPLLESRISAIVSHIADLTPAVDIIFFQEVSRSALEILLNDFRIQRSWFSSEADETNLILSPLTTMILLSKSRFASEEESVGKVGLGPVWRVHYRSHSERDALCCDIFPPSSLTKSSGRGIRLVNIHLDSLALQPSYRLEQVSTIASILYNAGCGFVAGDFNSILPEDEESIQANGLIDPWIKLHQGEPGYTWGIYGKPPFPPSRLDRIGTLGLNVQEVEIMHPGVIPVPKIPRPSETFPRWLPRDNGSIMLPWSDHSGLKCSFSLA